MYRSKIEWRDYTWNPITGCHHDCQYCYAKKMTASFSGDVRQNKMEKKDYSVQKPAEGSEVVYILEKPMMNELGKVFAYPFGFELTFHQYRMDTLDKLKTGNNILVGDMADIFGSWIPDSWIREVIGACMARPRHNYLFLTKNPERYINNVPTGMDNMWYGVSIARKSEMDKFNYLPAHCKTFINMDPILEDLEPERSKPLFQYVDWIILGAETGKNKVITQWNWIKGIVLQADNAGCPVFMRDSLIDIVGEKNMRREFPQQLKSKIISRKRHNKLYDSCSSCKEQMKKNEMITMLARSNCGEQPKQLGLVCRECFGTFSSELNTKIDI